MAGKVDWPEGAFRALSEDFAALVEVLERVFSELSSLRQEVEALGKLLSSLELTLPTRTEVKRLERRLAELAKGLASVEELLKGKAPPPGRKASAFPLKGGAT